MQLVCDNIDRWRLVVFAVGKFDDLVKLVLLDHLFRTGQNVISPATSGTIGGSLADRNQCELTWKVDVALSEGLIGLGLS